MGALDVNGIYKYAETDLASTFSTLLNTGQTSVSSALAAIKTSMNSRLTALEARQGVIGNTGTYTANASGIVTVPYGATFSAVYSVVCTSAFPLGTPIIFDVTARTTTSFTVQVRTNTGATYPPQDFAMSWIAVGTLA